MPPQRGVKVLRFVVIALGFGARFDSSARTLTHHGLVLVENSSRALGETERVGYQRLGIGRDYYTNRDYHEHQKAERQHHSIHNTPVCNAGCVLSRNWDTGMQNSPNSPPDNAFQRFRRVNNKARALLCQWLLVSIVVNVAVVVVLTAGEFVLFAKFCDSLTFGFERHSGALLASVPSSSGVVRFAACRSAAEPALTGLNHECSFPRSSSDSMCEPPSSYAHATAGETNNSGVQSFAPSLFRWMLSCCAPWPTCRTS